MIPSRKGRPRICVLVGSDRISFVERAPGQKAYRYQGNCDFQQLITAAGLAWEWLDVVRYHRGEMTPRLERYNAVITLIADPDQNPKSLQFAARLQQNRFAHVLNAPTRVLPLR